MTLALQDTAVTAKAATIPISIEVARVFGMPITDIGTYLSICIGCLVIIDYLWKWYRRYRTPIYNHAYLDKLESQEDKE